MKRMLLCFLLSIPAVQAYTQGCSNLVSNGNFSSGNTGFTTAYFYNPVSIVAEGTYAVVSQFNTVHSAFSGNDHTNPPTGLAMMINGSGAANTTVWQQTITGIVPNTVYYFSTWVNKQNGNPPPILQFSINGVQIGTNFSPTTTPNVWQQFFTSWNSGPNTSATIRLIDQVTAFGGNDFAIDDIFFTSTAPLQIASATSTPQVCPGAGGTITIDASGGVAPYQYSINNGTNYTSSPTDPYTFTGVAPGNYTVIIKDVCGNVSNTQQVTVGSTPDQTDPTISGCPGNIILFTGPGRTTCDQIANWAAPTATDNCGTPATVSTHMSGATFPVGNTVVTYTFTDGSNNSSTCSFTVTVVDNTAPVVSGCPGNQTVYTGSGNTTCSQTATWTPPSATDNCPGTITSSSTAQPGEAFPLGTTTVTYTFTDANGNQNSSCSFDVTVIDNTAPAISGCPVNQIVFTGPGRTTCNQTATWTPPTAADNCSSVSTSSTHTPGATFPVGNTTVSYTFTDAANNSSTCSFIIAVIDNTAPIARCKNYTLTLMGGAGTVTPGNVDDMSTDNCGITSRTVTPNTFNCAQAGTTVPVVLTVRDATGNSASCTAMVTIQYKPTCAITVTPCNTTYTGGNPNNIYLGYGPQCANISVAAGGGGNVFTYSWSGPNLSYLSCTSCANPTFTPTAPGTYTYTVTVTNVNGCSTTCTVTFCVRDVRVPGNGNNSKIYVCHAPPGNPANAHTLSISINAVPSHLGNHDDDYLGQCGEGCSPHARRSAPVGELVMAEEMEIITFPNPFTSDFHLRIESNAFDVADVTVFDLSGRAVEKLPAREVGSDIRLGTTLATGVYVVEVRNGHSVQRIKMTKQ